MKSKENINIGNNIILNIDDGNNEYGNNKKIEDKLNKEFNKFKKKYFKDILKSNNNNLYKSLIDLNLLFIATKIINNEY